ncbi:MULTISPECIES: RDD family protein [unclassified Helicobacter]|uniref:RDD family protein n=1 Tax=unclassified Helicobacter TaxID=2593540 RepID=UPI001F249FCB|nr:MULTISPECIES: RDD family protein [unclassified Helicobacter]
MKEVLQKTLLIPRLKAFIIDIFMIYVPILYFVTYFILGSAEAFRNNPYAIFLCSLLYGLVSSFLFYLKEQTPGFRYASIKLVNLDGKPIGFLKALVRFFVWLISMALVIGFFFPFFSKTKECLHDYICKTTVKVKDLDLKS